MFKRRGDRSNRYNAPEFEFDPLYVDAANGNYTLQSGSPARDIGFDISSYTQEDFAQNARPSGAGWDLGAFEGGAPTILYVRTRGSDNNSGLSPQKSLRTIQKAISLTSEAGSKIYVGPGVYRESLQIGSGSGSGAGSGSESQPIELIADTAGRYTLDSPGEVQIDGRNSSTTGITMTERTNWVIENFSFINQRENGIYATNSGLSINNCRFDVGTGYAIYATATGDITVDGCTFDRNDRSGNNIWVTPNNQSSPTSIRITRNDMAMRGDLYHSTGYQKGGSAIRGRSSSNRYVYGIIVFGSSHSQIESVEISNNQISDCYLPIYFSVPRSSNYETSIANNTVTGSCYSIYADSRRASKSVLINNIIDTCYYGVFGDRSRPRNFTVAGLVEHNITFNMERYRRSFESKVITESPKFFDAPAGDFSLIAGSPCIDAGMLIGAPSVDILGQSRPTDGDNDGIARIDIGALEQVAESTRVKVVQWREVGVDSNR